MPEALPGPGELYHHALEALREVSAGGMGVPSWDGLLGAIGKHLRAAKLMADAATTAEACWRLVMLGVLAPEPGGHSNQGPNPFILRVTAFGRSVFDEMHPLPTDPDGFVAATRGRLARLGLEIHFSTALYLREAAECFAHGQYTATSVMMGVVCESEIRLTTRAMQDSGRSDDRRLNHDRVAVCRAALDEALRACSDDPGWPVEIERYRGGMLGVFLPIINFNRNDAGHPTGIEFDRGGVYGALAGLPDAIVYLTRVRDVLQRGHAAPTP